MIGFYPFVVTTKPPKLNYFIIIVNYRKIYLIQNNVKIYFFDRWFSIKRTFFDVVLQRFFIQSTGVFHKKFHAHFLKLKW